MKKTTLLCTLVLALLAAHIAFGQEFNSANICRAGAEIAIDGEVDETWNKAAQHPVDNANQDLSCPWADENDFSASWRALWDDDYLYVLCEVRDAGGIFFDSANPWDDDAVELFVDGDNSKGTSYDGLDDFQWGWFMGDPAAEAIPGASTLPLDYSSIISEGMETDDGYTFEVKVPWALMAVSPADGHAMGFEIAIDDDDDGGPRDCQYMWNAEYNTPWTDPSTFGTITLTENDCGDGGNGGSCLEDWLGGLGGRTETSYIWSKHLGWLYIFQPGGEEDCSQVYLWSKGELGWFYTTATWYPFAYSWGTGGWIYFYGGNGDGSGIWATNYVSGETELITN